MAQVFPLNDDLSADEARQSLAGTLAALPDPWTLLRDRQIGDQQADPVDVVLIHPEIGVALVDESPRDPAQNAHRLRHFLNEQRFGEFFPGELPIVTLSVASDEFETLGEQLAAAFEAAPRLSLADADWADAVIELLMVPDDLAMSPVGDAAPSPELAPARREPFEEAPRERFDPPRERFEEMPVGEFDDVRRERFGEPPRDHGSSFDQGEPPLPLMVDWPFAASYQRRRRRGRIAALAVVFVLLAGAGFAAWRYAGDDLRVAINDITPRHEATPRSLDTAPPAEDAAPRSQIEVPLPPQSPGSQANQKPVPSSPPPVPAAPPVVMAQKPYAPPPPIPPKPTPVAPLPQVAVVTPPSSPPAPTPAPPQPSAPEPTAATPPTDSGQATASKPPPREEPPKQTAAAPPPAPAKPAPSAAVAAARPKATRTVKVEPPPHRAQPPQREPSLASRGHPSNSDDPPIDAADLPPLDEAPPAPQPPTQFAAPSRSSGPPAGGLGPPVPLWHAQQANNAPPPAAPASTPAAADAGNRECRPYTSSTTLTGRGLRVEGIACRGNDGQWRLVSEVPLR